MDGTMRGEFCAILSIVLIVDDTPVRFDIQLVPAKTMTDREYWMRHFVLVLVDEEKQVSRMVKPACCRQLRVLDNTGSPHGWVIRTIVSKNFLVQYAALALMCNVRDPYAPDFSPLSVHFLVQIVP